MTGEPVALTASMRGLTDRPRLHAILAGVTDGFCALDAGLRFTYVNDTAIEVMPSSSAGSCGEAASLTARRSTSSRT